MLPPLPSRVLVCAVYRVSTLTVSFASIFLNPLLYLTVSFAAIFLNPLLYNLGLLPLMLMQTDISQPAAAFQSFLAAGMNTLFSTETGGANRWAYCRKPCAVVYCLPFSSLKLTSPTVQLSTAACCFSGSVKSRTTLSSCLTVRTTRSGRTLCACLGTAV